MTQGEYQAVTGSNPSYFTGDPSRPVEQVSWNDAVAYCGTLTTRERAAGRIPANWAYRLPTEAEWEYACRAGTTTAYGWGNDADGGKGWCNGADQTGRETLGDAARDWSFFGWRDGYAFTAPVGRFKANAWRLHDMHGNVWEWCSDWYGAYPERETTDPTGPKMGESRVLRGGGWYYGSPQFCRSAYRLRATPGSRNGCCLGFRLV